MKKEKKYWVGLDIGTSSVGWAVTDKDYTVLKFNGKKMWGVHLFDEAKTAEGRRMQRGARRRLNRRKERIRLLQDFFAEEISRVDENFFIRMKNSDLYKEDKDEVLQTKYALFHDADFNDSDYHKKYPTIHHLIMDLIEDDSKKDIRLVYLACHYLLKNRGHFIFEGQDFNMQSSFESAISALQNHLRTEYDVEITINQNDLIRVLTDKNMNKTAKKAALKGIVGDTKFLRAVSATMIGSSQNLAALFEDEELKEADKKNIDFSSTEFVEKHSEYESVLGERIALLDILKEIYDASILETLLAEATESPNKVKYISSVFVNRYQKHGRDLQRLKKLIKNHDREEYDAIFRSETTAGNYVAYTRSNITDGKRSKAAEFAKKDAFYEFIKDKLTKLKGKYDERSESDKSVLDEIDEMLLEIELGTFMPKQKSSDNGVIPYQLKLEELRKILENQSRYYDFLNEKDEYGTVADKILSIMTFRIPYYVGPLNENSPFAWIQRKPQPITPWNFDDVVDHDASREAFIARLVGRCTYLKDETVLPKSSLLYNEFMVLNELNNLKINGEPISDELKKKIFDELFKKSKTVTLKKVQYLIKKEYNEMSDIALTGIDGDRFTQGLTSYLDFKNIIGDKVDDARYQDAIEEIIKCIVLYEKDKKGLRKRIKSNFGDLFTDQEIKRICGLNYKDWGRLSKKLLIGLEGEDTTTGEIGSIMYFMRAYQLNLMELMSSRFTFTEEIAKRNPVEDRELCYEMADELYLSPAVKRMLWQSLRITDEIRKIMGHDPEKIFIEMARDQNTKKGKKLTRKSRLIEFYKSGKQAFMAEIGSEHYNKMLHDLESEDDSRLRWDNLYLYYTQLGRCVYSLEPIDIEDLNNKNRYDQDHIYPKSKIYDDSLENRVLVKKELNSKKGNQYPIPQEVINPKCYTFWNMLHTKELIGSKKYARLIRRTPFTAEELTGFIERQIVETRQATKETANLLKLLCKDSEIVYSKAENASRFRQEFDLVKCRSVNDLHHMHDAYLNIVVGNVYNTKFTKSPRNFIKKDKDARGYNLENMFKYDVKRGNTVAWIRYDKEKKNQDATIIKVKNELQGTNFRFTRMNFIGSGELFKANLMRKGKGQVPQKENSPKSDISKYGGYNSASTAYFCLVESNAKKGKKKTLETIPLVVYKRIENGEENALKDYFEKELGLGNPKVLWDRIKIKSLLKVDGFYYHITAKSKNDIWASGAVQLLLSRDEQKLVKKIEKFLAKKSKFGKKDGGAVKVTPFDGIDDAEVNALYQTLAKKLEQGIYAKRRNNQAKNIHDAYSTFMTLETEKKLQVIQQILLLFQNYNSGCNLKEINLKARMGISLFSKNIDSLDEFKLINRSITGLFENEVDLLKL